MNFIAPLRAFLKTGAALALLVLTGCDFYMYTWHPTQTSSHVPGPPVTDAQTAYAQRARDEKAYGEINRQMYLHEHSDLRDCVAQFEPEALDEIEHGGLKLYWPETFSSHARRVLIPNCMRERGWSAERWPTVVLVP